MRSTLLALILLGCGPTDRVEGDEEGECDDAVDNDGDSRFDCADPGCRDAPICTRSFDTADPNEGRITPPSTPGNTPPVADAGPDLLDVNPGDNVPLAGWRSYDPDGDPLSYTWSVVRRPEGSFSEIIRATAEFALFRVDAPGVFHVELLVSDGKDEDLDGFAIRVFDGNTLPVADPGTERQIGVGELFIADATNSFDPDGDTITYRWTMLEKPVGSAFELGSKATLPTWQFRPDRIGVFRFSLVVNDGVSDSEPVSVAVSVVPI